ncbi:hypothetical protein ACXZ65_37925 [Streptomyces aculeolatus]
MSPGKWWSPEARAALAVMPKWLRPWRALTAGLVLLVVSVTVLVLGGAAVAWAQDAPNPCSDRQMGGNQCLGDNPNTPTEREFEEQEEKEQRAEERRKARAEFDALVEERKDELAASKGVLGAFNVRDRDGNPIAIYQVTADTGDWKAWDKKAQHFVVQIFFQFILWSIAFECWLIAWALAFSLAALLFAPAVRVANTWDANVVTELGLPALMLTFAAAVAGWHWMFGTRARGWGEAVAALTISAVSIGALASPVPLLLDEDQGAVGTARALAAEVAGLTLGQRQAGTEEESKAGVGGIGDAASREISRPITDAIVDAFVVKTSQLLTYGQTFSGSCDEDFRDMRVRQGVYEEVLNEERDEASGPLDTWINNKIEEIPGVGGWLADKRRDKSEAEREFFTGDEEDVWDEILATGPVEDFEEKCVGGSAAAAKAASPEKVGGVLFALLAAFLVALFIVVTVFAFLTAQFALVLEAMLAKFALVIGVAPGPGRAWLWARATSIGRHLALMVLSITALAVFIVVIDALLNEPTGPPTGPGARPEPFPDDEADPIPGGIIGRFVIIDVVCVAAFVYRRRLMRTAGSLAARARTRMGNSNFGGQSMTSPTDTAGPRSGLGRTLAYAAFATAASGGPSAARFLTGRPLGRRRGPLPLRAVGGALRGTARAAGATARGTTAAAQATIRGGAMAVRAAFTPGGRTALRARLTAAGVGVGLPAHVPPNRQGLRAHIARLRAARTAPAPAPPGNGQAPGRRRRAAAQPRPAPAGAGVGRQPRPAPAARRRRRMPPRIRPAPIRRRFPGWRRGP